eukprot:jgi/Galph1/5670/GphlegSOOS_G4310.1
MKLWIPRVVFGGITLTTFGLGCWQVQRYLWKKDLFEKREALLHAPPIQLPDTVGKEHEHRVIETFGTFEHEKECLIGPRPAPSFVPLHLLQWGGSIGYNVVTPLVRDKGEPVLVNRGWIPQRLSRHKSREKEDFYGLVKVQGVVSSGERPGFYTPDNDPESGSWLWLDAIAISDALGFKQPAYVVNLLFPVPPSGWPYPYGVDSFRDFTVTPSTHLMYVGTWYGLCLTFAVLTWIKFGPKRYHSWLS